MCVRLRAAYWYVSEDFFNSCGCASVFFCVGVCVIVRAKNNIKGAMCIFVFQFLFDVQLVIHPEVDSH